MAAINYEVITRHVRADNKFPISIRVYHEDRRRYISSGYYAERSQLNSKNEIKDRILLTKILNIISSYEKKLDGKYITGMSIDALIAYLTMSLYNNQSIDFFAFCREHIEKIKAKRPGSAANFKTILNNLIDFTGREVVFTTEITRKFIENFSEYLQTERVITRINQKGNKVKTVQEPVTRIANKIKDFKTLFNEAKKKYNNEDFGIMPIPHNPFKSVKIQMPPGKKKGYTCEQISRLYKLYEYYAEMSKRERLAIDMFFLSFFLCGINEVDLYNCETNMVKNGRFSYNRSKTKGKRTDSAFISVKIEPPAQGIISKYAVSGPYLFSFHCYCTNQTFNSAVGSGLRSLVKKYLKDYPEYFGTTFYHARHSLATIARNEVGISKDDIAMMLNHSTESRVTDIYINVDFGIIDRANKKVIDFFFAQLKTYGIASDPLLK